METCPSHTVSKSENQDFNPGSRNQASANTFNKEPDSQYFRLCSLCATTPLSNQRQYGNKWVWCVLIKLYLQQQGMSWIWPVDCSLAISDLEKGFPIQTM